MKKNLLVSNNTGILQQLSTFALLLALSTSVSAQTFNGAGNPQPIPVVGTGGFPCVDGPTNSVATVSLVGNIGANFAIDNVTLDLTHTFDNDLEIDLISPDGTVWDLSSDNGGAGDNYTNTVFQDGAPSITTGAAPFTGTFQAEEGPFLTGFSGDAVNGNWTLSICDDAGGDSGTLNSFSITFVDFVAPIAPDPIPTINEWGMILLSLLLLGFGMAPRFSRDQ